MSETNDPVSVPDVLPAVPDPPAPPQESTPDSGEGEQPPEHRDQDPEGRRVAQVRARLAAAERERDAQRAELEFYRRQAANVAPEDETPEQTRQRERAQIRSEVERDIRTETFHQQGAAQYGDWKQRCDDLVAMGADAGFASLLVEMPGGEGVKVAAALAADPDAVQRIAQLRTERARAVALGKYAAGIDDGPAPARTNGNGDNRLAAQPVTRAPAPIRPVVGRASPTFNEYTADPQTLADRYMKEIMDKQIRR